MIAALIARLDHYGILDNTYIVFSTDNGYHIGQHRLQPSKQCAYREDTNIPFIVRGPGVGVNQTSEIVTSHTDLAPTFLALAGAPIPEDLDGSVIPLQAAELQSVEDQQSFGELVNIETWGITIPEGKYGMNLYSNHTYKALRLIGGGYDLLYTVWCTGAHELYDLVVSLSMMSALSDIVKVYEGQTKTDTEKHSRLTPTKPIISTHSMPQLTSQPRMLPRTARISPAYLVATSAQMSTTMTQLWYSGTCTS